MITGETLRQLRGLKGLKQKTMAHQLHISQAAYSKLEKRKKINGHTLEQLKTILDYTDLEIEAIQKLLSP